MPPKKNVNKNSKKILEVNESAKNSISNLFNKIQEKDLELKECSSCHDKIKSCLFKDHLLTKCTQRISLLGNTTKRKSCDEEEIVFLGKSNNQNNSSQTFQIDVKREYVLSSCKIEPIESIDINVSLETNRINNAKRKSEYDLEIKTELITELKNSVNEEENESYKEKRRSIKRIKSEGKESKLDEHTTLMTIDLDKNLQVKSESVEFSTEKFSDEHFKDFDIYLINFTNAIHAVLAEETFACLLNEKDYETIEKFSRLKNSEKMLYVRLFQRKFKWIQREKINYDQISLNLEPLINGLLNESFLIDESNIDTYEEIIYQLKLPQLKELTKICHIGISQMVKLRSELIKLILNHFKTQKSIKFNFRHEKSNDTQIQQAITPHFMNQCKKVLGKCYKLNKTIRDVFVRVLLIYSLSSSGHLDPGKNSSESGQAMLLQILMVNMNKVKYMPYEIKLNVKIFKERTCLLRYQDSLEHEFELLNLIETKEYDEAFDYFDSKINDFKKVITDPSLNEYNLKLPIYLRGFTCSSVYCKILSIYAFEILQRLHKYNEANSIFEFLLYNQNLYLLSYRSKWFERVALNCESHLKDPIKSLETLVKGLNDFNYVRRAGRLALYQRLLKMSQTKKYLKNIELKDKLKSAVVQLHFEFQEAPTVEITGTILHSEYIPGRKNIFIQNFENDEDTALSFDQESDTNDSDLKTESSQSTQSRPKSDTLIKNRYNISVEMVALTHYIKNLNYTHGKHTETRILSTLFGMLFWDVIFDKTVFNVFVDKFQSCPLDLQTDHFYLNRKEAIDSRLELLQNSPIEFICELYSNCWNEYMGTECSLVSWTLFEDLNEFLSLVRCFTSNQLTCLCKFMAQNYRYCRSGGPDLIVWSTSLNKCKFVEVKGPGDRLSHKQIMWMDFFLKNSIEVEVCYVKGQNSKRL